MLKEIENTFEGDLVHINTYLTSKISEDQMYNIALNDAGAEFDALTNLRSRTHFGRPNFVQIFASIRTGIEAGTYLPGSESSLKTTVSVFYCGPGTLAKDLKPKVNDAKSKHVDFKFQWVALCLVLWRRMADCTSACSTRSQQRALYVVLISLSSVERADASLSVQSNLPVSWSFRHTSSVQQQIVRMRIAGIAMLLWFFTACSVLCNADFALPSVPRAHAPWRPPRELARRALCSASFVAFTRPRLPICTSIPAPYPQP